MSEANWHRQGYQAAEAEIARLIMALGIDHTVELCEVHRFELQSHTAHVDYDDGWNCAVAQFKVRHKWPKLLKMDGR